MKVSRAMLMLAAVLAVARAQPVLAQTMGNDDVVKMVRAGLSDEIVLGAIRGASNSNFDVSVDGLTSLQNAHISSRVITAMQESSANNAKGNIFGRVGHKLAKAKDLRVGMKKGEGSDTDKSAGASEPSETSKAILQAAPQTVQGVSPAKETAAAKAPTPVAAPEPSASEATIATPKSGQPASFVVAMTTESACTKVRQFLVAQDVELTTSDCSSGQISAQPRVARKGLNEHTDRWVIAFIPKGSSTEIRVRDLQKGHGFFSSNGGKSASGEGEAVNPKESVKIALSIRGYLVP